MSEVTSIPSDLPPLHAHEAELSSSAAGSSTLITNEIDEKFVKLVFGLSSEISETDSELSNSPPVSTLYADERFSHLVL